MTDLHSQVLAKLAELRATAEAAEEGSSSPWVVEYFATSQRITNGAAIIVAETFVGSPLPGHQALWAPEPQHIATWNPAFALGWIAWAEDVAAEHPNRIHRCDGDLETGQLSCRHLLGLARALGIQEGTT